MWAPEPDWGLPTLPSGWREIELMSSSNELRATFDAAAEIYDAARPDYPAQLYRDLIELSGLRQGAELGCGGKSGGTAGITIPRSASIQRRLGCGRWKMAAKDWSATGATCWSRGLRPRSPTLQRC